MKTAREISRDRVKQNIRTRPECVDIEWLVVNGYDDLAEQARSAQKFNKEHDDYNRLRFEAALEIHKAIFMKTLPLTFTADGRAQYAVEEADALLRRLKETEL